MIGFTSQPQRIRGVDAWAAKPVLEGQPKQFYLPHYYHVLNATGHAAAPKLMTHAYNTAVNPPEPEEQLLLSHRTHACSPPNA
jgi:hypothetical protein